MHEKSAETSNSYLLFITLTDWLNIGKQNYHWRNLLDKQVRVSKKICIHFQQRPSLQDKRRKNNLQAGKKSKMSINQSINKSSDRANEESSFAA